MGVSEQDHSFFESITEGVNRTYVYRVYARNESGLSSPSNEKTIAVDLTDAILTTSDVTSITDSSATAGGDVTNYGETAVTECGVVWNTSPNPTIDLATKTIAILVGTTFSSNIIGLLSSTDYYIRAYVTNSLGTFYGNEVSFTTADDAITTVVIGSQEWTNRNLNVSRYRNGDIIPQVTDPSQWSQLTTGAWCYYDNDPANGPIYGKLYNWYAVNDPRGLAPVGYHIASDAEWTTLTNFLGDVDPGDIGRGAGGKMKATTLWNSPNSYATNSSGFTALPGGYFNVPFTSSFLPDTPGSFRLKGYQGYWWSSTAILNTEPFIYTSIWCRSLYYLGFYNDKIEVFDMQTYFENYGYSVRCVRD